MSNPLLKNFTLPPFSKIKTTHFKPAFKEALKLAETEIDAITDRKEAPDFKNTVEALAFSGERLRRISSLFFNLNSAETNAEIQRIAQEVAPWLSAFQNDLSLNIKLFKRVAAVYDKRKDLDLSEEQKMLLDQQYKSFVRNGANLTEEKKQRLREIDKNLAQLSLKFGENVLADTNAYELHLTDKTELEGLPESDCEAARETAKSKNKEGYLFTLHYPSYMPFMKYVKNRDLRKKMALAYGKRGFQPNPYNNEDTVLKIVGLRHERARLLGFKTHAEYVLQERMAKTPKTVNDFLADLLRKSKPVAEKQFRELQDFAQKEEGVSELQSWDIAYYSNKLKDRLFDLKEEDLRPYFELSKVLQGAFKIAGKLYGLKFKEVFELDTYHDEVKTYRVSDENGNEKAVFYADFFPRQGKRGGAWMTTFKEQYRKNGVNERPQVAIVCNFSKPTKTQPSLLTFSEVTTLFHEFGHALHAILADTTYPGLSGTNVYWDFVELPSQLMENWCYEKEALELFAYHYKNGEPLPLEFIERIKESSNFLEGIQTLRQLSFGLLDMAWHDTDPQAITAVKAWEEKAFSATRLYPANEENCMSTSFSHIFQGGYSAGYYSYKWAEVLDADAFAYFKENGIFNPEIANKFKKHILTKGGTENPLGLYKKFRGKEPSNEALLKRAGLA